MKNKKLLALALLSVLTVSAFAPSALAAVPTVGSDTAVTAEETERPVRRGHRGRRPENADTGAASGRQGGQHGAGEPENAIGRDAAAEKALLDAGLTAEQASSVRTRASCLDDGTVIYRVRFVYEGQCYHYQVDALSGAITGKSVETAPENPEPRGRGGRGGGRADCPNGSNAAAGV